MNTLSTKSSLYDLLSMIIPGYLVIFLFHEAFFQHCKWIYDDVTFGITAFAVSYIVGLALHWFSKQVFRTLRNCKCLTSMARDKVNKVLEREGKTKIETEDYYEAYYAASNYVWSSVPVLEAQYSFLRSAVIVEVLYLILGCKAFDCSCVISFLAILLVITVLIMIAILFETHKRVWEDYYYRYSFQKQKKI